MRQAIAERKRGLLAAGLFSIAVVAVAATPQLLGSRVGAAFQQLDDARPAWIWLAALLVVVTLVAFAQAWRNVIRCCGGAVGRVDSVARYAVGSGVNTVMPARLGDAARIALFSRTLEHPERVWTSAGAYTTIGAARTLWIAFLVLGGFAFGALPLWPVLVCASFVAGAVLVGAVAPRWSANTRLAHFFDSYRELGRHPREAAPMLAWLAVATAARVGAAAAIVSSLGVHRSLGAALLIVPALEVGSLVPLAPGALGLSNGAVVVALNGYGIGVTTALTIGIALHAVEAAAGVVCAAIGGLRLAGERAPLARRAAVVLTAAVVIAGAVGMLMADVV